MGKEATTLAISNSNNHIHSNNDQTIPQIQDIRIAVNLLLVLIIVRQLHHTEEDLRQDNKKEEDYFQN